MEYWIVEFAHMPLRARAPAKQGEAAWGADRQGERGLEETMNIEMFHVKQSLFR